MWSESTAVMGHVHEPVSDLGHSRIRDPIVYIWYITDPVPAGVWPDKSRVLKNSFRKWRVGVLTLVFLSLSSYVLQELVETERDYVRDLGCVVEVCVFRDLMTYIRHQELSREYQTCTPITSQKLWKHLTPPPRKLSLWKVRFSQLS